MFKKLLAGGAVGTILAVSLVAMLVGGGSSAGLGARGMIGCSNGDTNTFRYWFPNSSNSTGKFDGGSASAMTAYNTGTHCYTDGAGTDGYTHTTFSSAKVKKGSGAYKAIYYSSGTLAETYYGSSGAAHGGGSARVTQNAAWGSCLKDGCTPKTW